MDDLIAAMDKRSQGQIVDYDHQHGLLTGYVMGVEIGAASVQLEGSGRYLKSVPTLQDMELAVGDLVLLVRAGRSGWLIVGSASSSETTLPSVYRYDHGSLDGLGDDDHPHYFLADGTRAVSGGIEGSGYPDIGSTTTAEKFGNAYLALDRFVYPDNDAHSTWDRFVNLGRSPEEHWHQGSDELTWTGWASYTGYATPDNISRDHSCLHIGHSAVTKAFYYRTAYTAGPISLYMRGIGTRDCSCGVMIDDGVDAADGEGANNFYRVFLYMPSGQLYVNVVREYRSGGGAVTTTATTCAMDMDKGHCCMIYYGIGTPWTNWGAAAYLFGESELSTFLHWDSALAWAWTPARMGIFYENYVAANNRRYSVDWWQEG